MSADKIEDILDGLSSTAGVIGVVICDVNGIPIRDTFAALDRSQAIAYANTAALLVRDTLPIVKEDGGLTTLRVRTSTVEFLVRVSPQYLIVIVQDPQLAS
jgi:predicted regulator of Ras-like GTPase activity (Roadblock/LC7/MglB family)